ncbi:MAG: insulinase family protein [Saprospiraceae bacterium]|nr:insulinase family protein [Saprospiraceae bacterium]MDW8484715.1 pitrilysin family protein [Saprospiraceae bacterium]
MKYRILIAVCGLVLFSSIKAFAQTTPSGAPVIPLPTGDVRKKAPQPGTPPKIQIGKAATKTLKNGLTVIVVENHKLPEVSFRIFIDFDPVLEKDAAGYADMAGELLSKGTKNRTKAQLDEEVDFIGASLSSDANGVSGSCLSKHTDKLLDLLADVLLNPAFPAEELDKAKRRAESALAAAKNDPDAIAANVANVLRYGKDHPYGENMTEKTLAKISLDQIKKYYQTYFKPNIAYLVIVGDIKQADAFAKAEKYFGKWKKAKVPKHTYPIPKAPEKTSVAFVDKTGAVQSVINITYPVELPPNHPDVIPARLMNTLLGGYFNSRVNANLREKHGYTYGARTSLSPDRLIGSFSATASVRNEVTDSAIAQFLFELERLRNEPVAEDELQLVKNVLTGQFSRSLEEPGTIAQFALNIARYKLPADYYENYLSNLQKVTPADIQAMARKYVRPNRAHILVVGNKDEVADRLKRFSADGQINFYDSYGDPVKVADQKAAANMTAEAVIRKYLQAIGGEQAINTVKDIEAIYEFNLQGMGTLEMSVLQKDDTKVLMRMSMQGQVMNSRVYNNGKGKEDGMGGSRTLTGEDLEDMKEQAYLFKEAAYLTKGYRLSLKGIENVGGKDAYVIAVERPGGKKSTDYYEVTSGLKLREVRTEEGQNGSPTTVITEFDDYKPVQSVLLPHTITMTGAFPIPLKGIAKSIKINSGIPDSVFDIK